MSGAATAAFAATILAVTTILALFLAIWPPMLAAGTLSLALAVDETRRRCRRWRVATRWARRDWGRRSG